MSLVGYIGIFESYNSVFSCYHIDPAFGFFLQPLTNYSFFYSKFYLNYDFVYFTSPTIYMSSYFIGLIDPFYMIAYVYCNNLPFWYALHAFWRVIPGSTTLYREYWDYEGTDS